MKKWSFGWILAGLVGVAVPASACTPVPYLFELFSASSPLTFVASMIRFSAGSGFAWGGDRVGPSAGGVDPDFLKLFLALSIITGLKAWFIQRNVNPEASFGAILRLQIKGNLVSTFVPFLVSLGFAVPIFIPITLMFCVYFMANPARLLAQAYFNGNAWAQGLGQFFLGVTPIVSMIWLGKAKSALMAASWLQYWGHKGGFCTFTIATGLFLTTAIEAGILFQGLKPETFTEGEYFKRILHYNTYALLALFLIAAAIALPLRFAAPDFLL